MRPIIDWHQVIDDMGAKGVTRYQIAKRLGVQWSTVQSWRDCKEDITYGSGRALLRLHAEICGAGMTMRRMAEGEEIQKVKASPIRLTACEFQE